MVRGWIKDYRQELESDIWLMPPLYHRVWQWLKYKVNHEEREIPLRDGTTQKVMKGQHFTSIRQIAQGVGWYEGRKWKEPNPKTIRTILKWLEKQGMITLETVKGNNGYTLITIVNWELYQAKEDYGNNEYSFEKHSADINKNDKNDKNEFINDDDNIVVPLFGIEKAIREEGDPDLIEVKNHFMKRSQRIPFSPLEEKAMADLLDEGIPVEIIKKGIDLAFERFVPKYKGHRIKSFNYCVDIIRELYEAEKQGGDRYETRKVRSGGNQEKNRSYQGFAEGEGYYQQYSDILFYNGK